MKPQAVESVAGTTMHAVAGVMIAIGVIAFVVALMRGAAAIAWQAYLVNLLFFLGVAQGAVVASAAFYLTQAKWGGSTPYRLGEAFAPFLWVGFFLFFGLYFGRSLIFPWVTHPIAQKAAWLNVPFLFARDGIGLGVMAAASFAFIRVSRSRRRASVDDRNRRNRVAAAFDTILGAAGRGSIRGSLYADLIRSGDVARAGVAQHAFRLVFFRRRFLERIGRDGSHSGRAAWPPGRAQPIHQSCRHARLWQDGLRVLGVLDLPGVRAVHRDLVRRSAGRNFLYRPAGASHAVVAAVGGVPRIDLADPIRSADECANQKIAADSRHRCRLWGSSEYGSSATCWWFRRCRSTRSRLGRRNF